MVVAECELNSDCPKSELCIENFCRTPCANNYDCSYGRPCIDDYCRCLCASNADCAAGDVCSNCVCLAAPSASCGDDALRITARSRPILDGTAACPGLTGAYGLLQVGGYADAVAVDLVENTLELPKGEFCDVTPGITRPVLLRYVVPDPSGGFVPVGYRLGYAETLEPVDPAVPTIFSDQVLVSPQNVSSYNPDDPWLSESKLWAVET